MKTIMMLMARYDGRAMVGVDVVREDYFEGMARETFVNKIESGEIPLPMARLGKGRKAPRMIPVKDLADYLDACADEARQELGRKVG